MRVEIKPEILRWAQERSGKSTADLLRKFPHLRAWEAGGRQPTLKQLESFAKAVYVPFGYLLLDQPPNETLPIRDFRTPGSRMLSRPSPHLLDTIYACQERQEWYIEFALSMAEEPIKWVGSYSESTPVAEAAKALREMLGFDIEARRNCRTWEEALRMFVQQVEDAGVLVMVSGIVGSDTARKLDTQEFRGFALSDPHAPLIFINGSDSKSGQMFTLAHELAHLALGYSGLSNASLRPETGLKMIEFWCNGVAAEILVPLSVLRNRLQTGESLEANVSRLTREFKVSTLVILRRLLDVRFIGREQFDAEWEREIERLSSFVQGKGGHFTRMTLTRVSRRFAEALVGSAVSGETLYRDAFRMLGVRKQSSFESVGRELGVIS